MAKILWKRKVCGINFTLFFSFVFCELFIRNPIMTLGHGNPNNNMTRAIDQNFFISINYLIYKNLLDFD